MSADVDPTGPTLTGLHFALSGQSASSLHVTSPITIDASDWGDVIQVSGTAFECGPDPKSRYHEPSAPDDLSNNPHNEMNPITWPMIIEETSQDAVIPRPPRYDDRYFARASRISAEALKDLNWDRPVRTGGILHWPDAGKQSPRQLSIYTVRRIVDGTDSTDKRTSILLNYTLGQDYPLERLPSHVAAALEATEAGASQKNIVEMTRDQRQIIFDDAKRHSLSLLYNLQTLVHELAPDKTNSFRRFRLSKEFGTPDDLPPKPYIRESLRLKAMYMMKEQDGRNTDGFTKDFARERFAQVMYPDGIFCWQFHYDFHNTGRAYLRHSPQDAAGDETGPWSDYEKPDRNTRYLSDRSLFPLRSLIPQSMNGLLGAQKNLGYSSIVCAAIRLHDQGIAVGQAAGAVAAVALQHKVQPGEIPYSRNMLENVRHALCGAVPTDKSAPLLLWPYRDLPADHPNFVAINRLAAIGILPAQSLDVDCLPNDRADDDWIKAVVKATKEQLDDEANVPDAATLKSLDKQSASPPMSRAEFCQQWWNAIKEERLRPWQRLSENDADNDGIPDIEDPAPFTHGKPIVWRIGRPEPHQDGLPADDIGLHPETQRFNFTTANAPAVNGFFADQGQMFSSERGYGWTQDVSTNSRRRNLLPETIRDTFVFTREMDVWECAVADGHWKVTACLGDAGHIQTGQKLTVEENAVAENENTASGVFIEVSTTVHVSDGRLTVQLGLQKPACNTCLNWLIIEPVRIERKISGSAVPGEVHGGDHSARMNATLIDRSVLRQ